MCLADSELTALGIQRFMQNRLYIRGWDVKWSRNLFVYCPTNAPAIQRARSQDIYTSLTYTPAHTLYSLRLRLASGSSLPTPPPSASFTKRNSEKSAKEL